LDPYGRIKVVDSSFLATVPKNFCSHTHLKLSSALSKSSIINIWTYHDVMMEQMSMTLVGEMACADEDFTM
jgi:hypothetical protein